MKKLLTLVAALALATGFSVAYGEGLPVEGSWGMGFDTNGAHIDMIMKLQNQTMTMTSVCNVYGHTATAWVTIPAQYDASTITVPQEAHNSVSQDGVDCNVSVQPGRMNYVIQGNNLVLTRDGYQEQITLTRR